jgi:hypothetical protein
MGLAFDLSTVNWLSYLLQPDGPIPRRESQAERDSLELFLRRLPDRFFSSKGNEQSVRRLAEEALHQLDNVPYGQAIPIGLLKNLQRLLSNYPWIGMIVPSLENNELDHYLSSPEFLRALVYEENWPDSGLVLQPEDMDDGPKALLDVFPPFQTALNEVTRWPGMLFWTPNRDSIFLPFPEKTKRAAREYAGWALSNLKLSRLRGLTPFKNAYIKQFPGAQQNAASITTLLHISDLHIGSAEAAVSLPRLQQLLRNMIAELPKGQKAVTVISGDLIDSPKESHYDSARQFMDVVRNLTAELPVLVWGNHDVRNDGYLSEDFRSAIRIPVDRIRWMDDRQLGLVGFNSVVGGKLARGQIGRRQLSDIGNDIDIKRNWADYTLVGVVHHHPMPVDQPSWYAPPFYERVFGRFFDRAEELEDAPEFNDFLGGRRFAAVLHGHKHIPRIAEIGGPQQIGNPHRIAVFGCGSSVGKVPTKDNKIFLSVNRIDINHRTSSISCRLMVERTLGAGMEEWEKHELLYAQRLAP